MVSIAETAGLYCFRTFYIFNLTENTFFKAVHTRYKLQACLQQIGPCFLFSILQVTRKYLFHESRENISFINRVN